MADEEDFERSFLTPLSCLIQDCSTETKKDVHMGGDADNVNGRLLTSKKRLSKARHINDLQIQVTTLRASLEDWKHIILRFKSVLLWEKQWHTSAIVGVTSTLFMVLWLADASFLTLLSFIGLTVTLADYLVPTVSASLFKSEEWTKDKEEQLEEICRIAVALKHQIVCHSAYFMSLRTTKPKMYYFITFVALIGLMWLGSNVNNLLLTYLVVLVVLIYPGLEHHGILSKYKASLASKICDLTEQAKQKIGAGDTRPKIE